MITYEPPCGTGGTEPSGSLGGGSSSCGQCGEGLMASSFCIAGTCHAPASASMSGGAFPIQGRSRSASLYPDSLDSSLQQAHRQSCRATTSFSIPLGHVSSQQADVQGSTNSGSFVLPPAWCWRSGNRGASLSRPRSSWRDEFGSFHTMAYTAGRVPLPSSSGACIPGMVRSVYPYGILYHSVPLHIV